jgi:hypothetical protein
MADDQKREKKTPEHAETFLSDQHSNEHWRLHQIELQEQLKLVVQPG